jgi:hypothetical protein
MTGRKPHGATRRRDNAGKEGAFQEDLLFNAMMPKCLRDLELTWRSISLLPKFQRIRTGYTVVLDIRNDQRPVPPLA